MDLFIKKYNNQMAISYKHFKTPLLSCVFFHIRWKEVNYVEKNIHCKALHGLQSLYSIMSFFEIDRTLLRTSVLSYFCISFVNSDWTNCRIHLMSRSRRLRGQFLRVLLQLLSKFRKWMMKATKMHDSVSTEPGDKVEMAVNFMIYVDEANEDGVKFSCSKVHKTQVCIAKAYARVK